MLRPSSILAFSVALTACARIAFADGPPRWHLEAGGAHAVGDPQAREFGFGAQGQAAIEMGVSRAIGAQLEVGALWLSNGAAPADPTIAPHGHAAALGAMLGLRARPVGEVAGPWIDANLGYVRTGALDRFGFDAHAGYDWRIGAGRWDAGPYVGYLQVVQPGDALRPADAHVVSIGVHVAIGVERKRAAPPAPPPAAPRPPPPAPPPPPPAPPADRDKDGVPDAEDACPDVPGIRTGDRKTNGCPPQGDRVRVVRDRIEYDDVIRFDTDSIHVHRASWPILQKLARFIVEREDIQEVDITGHADERGSEAHNVMLSQWRAEAVRDLLARFGVDANRLTTRGYGYSKPRAEGHSEAEWRQNRRAEFIITKVKNAEGGSTTLPPPGGQP